MRDLAQSEIANQAQWLDRHWAPLTTGSRLHSDTSAVRALVREAVERRLTAIGVADERHFGEGLPEARVAASRGHAVIGRFSGKPACPLDRS